MLADQKRCFGCDTSKPLSGFYRNRRRPDGRQTQCKACSSSYRRAHREAQKALDAKYSLDPLYPKLKDGLQRARQLSVPAVKSADLIQYWADNGISADHCYYTGIPLGQDWHLDHKVPLSRGGTHTVENLVPCTPAANLDKRTMTAEEYGLVR